LTYDLVVQGGLVITSEQVLAADVAVVGERIAAVGRRLTGARVLDATGLYVLPGAIDGHVHFDDPTFPPFAIATADTFATGTVAAACGGVTSVVDFAQPGVGQPLVGELERRRTDADGAVVDYGLHLNIRDPDPERIDEIGGIVERGVPSFKLYMSYDGYRIPDRAIFRAMREIARQGGLAIVHAENDDVIDELTARLATEGKTGPEWLATACPPEAEAEAVRRAAMFAHVAGARLLVFHLSCAEAVDEVAAARRRGVSIAGEATPHGLVIDQAELRSGDLRAQSLAVRPPIREEPHRRALWRGLASGDVDIVSSDHCPRLPMEDVHPAGVSGVEVRLGLVHTFGVRRGLIDLRRWVDACCTRPATIFGLAAKGRLSPGCDADVVLFDPERRITLSPETLHSAIPFSSYQGIDLHGWPVTTISRGEVIVEDGAFVGEAGRGRFLERTY